MALSSRQCCSPATYLARSIYAELPCEAKPPAQKPSSAPLNHKATNTHCRNNVPPGGTVVPTVLFPCDVPCSFHLRRTAVRSETPCAEAFLGTPQAQGNGKRSTIETTVPPGWHCRPDSVFPLRRTLLVPFTQNCRAKRNPLRRSVPPPPLTHKATNEHSLLQPQCHRVALSSRQCSLQATYLARSIYAELPCEAKPPAQKPSPPPLNHKAAENDPLLKQQCHPVALSSRQCSLQATYLARSIYAELPCEAKPPAQKPSSPPLNHKATNIHCRNNVPPGGTVVPTVFSPGDVPCSFHLRRTAMRSETPCAEAFPAAPEPQGNERTLTVDATVFTGN